MKQCRMQIAVIWVMVAISVHGCSKSATDPGPGNRVQFEVEGTVFREGDTISIAAVNRTRLSLAYPAGFCPMVLQRLEGNSWIVVAQGISVPSCSFSIEYLGALARVKVPFVIPSPVPSGSYRVLLPTPTTNINDAHAIEPPQPTNSFEVES